MERDKMIIVFIFYLMLAICACVGSIQIVVRIAICLTPYYEHCYNTCCFIYQIEKERMRRRTVIHPLLIVHIPTAQVTHVDNIPYPASIVSTAEVEIV